MPILSIHPSFISVKKLPEYPDFLLYPLKMAQFCTKPIRGVSDKRPWGYLSLDASAKSVKVLWVVIRVKIKCFLFLDTSKPP